MRRLACGFTALGFLWVLWSFTAAAQSPAVAATFRARTDAVLVDFRVVDARGQFVRDLSRDDVQVMEDGRPQSISTFSRVDIPVEHFESPSFGREHVDPDVASNADSDGRLFLIALDDVNIHPLRAPTVKALAREFIEHYVGPRDRAALVATSGRYALALEFTNNRQRLLATVDKFQAGYGAFDVSDRGSNKEAARSTFRYLAHMASWLGAIEGRRKAIVFISEGFTADIPVGRPQVGSTDVSVAQNPADGDQPSVRFAQEDNEASNAFAALSGLSDDASELRDTVDAATRANVAIYGIDPRGQPGSAATTITPIATLIGDDAFSARRVASQQLLRVLSAATGGFALTNSNGFDDAFARVVDDNSSYYVLGYTSTNTKRDGRFRRIRLVTTRPGLRVRARAGYKAVNDKKTKPDSVPAGWTRELADLMTVPAQVSGLTLTVSAASFRGASRNSVAVVVEASGRDLHLADTSAPASDDINLVIVAADENGNIKASEKGTLALHLSATSRQAVGRSGIRLASRLELSPGRYAVRVAGVEGNDRRGSVFYDLDVPDFKKGPLTMSGVLLTTHDAASTPTSGTDRVWRTVLNSPPTAARTFRRDDELSVYAEVYDNDSRKGHDISVVTTVGDEQGHVQFSNEEHVTAARGKGETMSPHHVVVPLRDLLPGAYLLRMEAKSTAADVPSVFQRVPFNVQ